MNQIPQMSPLKWFSLFILFSIVLILFNQMNFSSFKTDPSTTTEKKSIFKKMNWIENDKKLFSTFDPSTNLFNLSLNWTSTLLGLIIIPSMFWLTLSRINIIWNKINLNLHNEFKNA